MDLDPNQVDALRIHTEHEFWSEKKEGNYYAPDEVTQKPLIAEAPFSLRLQNGDHILRSFLSSEGEECFLKSSLINGLEWEYLSKGNIRQRIQSS